MMYPKNARAATTMTAKTIMSPAPPLLFVLRKFNLFDMVSEMRPSALKAAVFSARDCNAPHTKRLGSSSKHLETGDKLPFRDKCDALGKAAKTIVHSHHDPKTPKPRTKLRRSFPHRNRASGPKSSLFSFLLDGS